MGGGGELKALLETMPGHTLDQVEVISNPSARYNAQGGAVINSITAKGRKLGTNGTATLGAGTGEYGRSNAGLGLNHRTAALNVYGSLDRQQNRVYATTNEETYICVSASADRLSGQLFCSLYLITSKLMTTFRWGCLLLLLAGPAQAQQVPDYRFSQDILAQWRADTAWWNYQNYAVQFSQIGDYRHTMAAEDAYLKGRKQWDNTIRFNPAYVPQFRAVAAQPELLRRTAGRQLVIFNEAHYQPLNRVFTRSMLAGLYAQGFRYLCVEDLTNGPGLDAQLNERKYAIRTTGYYQLEPQYGELLRTAMALGYTLVPYEYVPAQKPADPMAGLRAREMGQARNIQQLLVREPQAKIVVHVGYGHLIEKLSASGNGAMAAYLKQYTGLDPFTINQVDLLEQNDPAHENPYRALLPADQPSVFRKPDGALFSNTQDSSRWDASVYFPPTTYAHGRPTWLLLGGDRRYYPLGAKPRAVAFPCRVRAYKAGEDVVTAIPADVVEWQSAREDLALVLGSGRYTLLFQDAQGHVQQRPVRVP